MMDNETVERLIEYVREHVFLYDVGHKEYKNVSLKMAVWDSIGKEINQSGADAKKKWKTIRDGYTKYKKQMQAALESGRTNFSYTWASQLGFLDHYSSQAPGPPAAAEVRAPSPRSSEQTPSPPPCAAPEVWVSELPANSGSTPTATQFPSVNNRSRLSRLASSNREEDSVDKVIRFLTDRKRKQHDAVDNLFLSYADTFKKFPPREQSIVRFEIAKLFSGVEMKLLEAEVTPAPTYSLVTLPVYSEVNAMPEIKKEVE